MGCDIHCYIEYKENDKWRSFGGCINPGRNYWMFAFMNGVRASFPQVVETRGRTDYAYKAACDDRCYIDSTLKGDCSSDNFGELTFSRERAENYIKKGYSEGVTDSEGRVKWITNPDNHSHSWMTAPEFEACLAAYLKQSGFSFGALKLEDAKREVDTLRACSLPADVRATTNEREQALSDIREYWAILFAMQAFDRQGRESRLVFWFDN